MLWEFQDPLASPCTQSLPTALAVATLTFIIVISLLYLCISKQNSLIVFEIHINEIIPHISFCVLLLSLNNMSELSKVAWSYHSFSFRIGFFCINIPQFFFHFVLFFLIDLLGCFLKVCSYQQMTYSCSFILLFAILSLINKSIFLIELFKIYTVPLYSHHSI